MNIDLTPVKEIVPTLNKNATFKFADYGIEDGKVIAHFVCSNPGPAMPSDYYVTITEEELNTVPVSIDSDTLNIASIAIESLFIDKLQRKYRAQGVAEILEPLRDLEVIA